MAKISVPATRMELLKLKRRSALAKRGHKLLKDKLDGLIQEFLSIIEAAKKIRGDVEKEFLEILSLSILLSSYLGKKELAKIKSFITFKEVELKVSHKNLMGVVVPRFRLEEVAPLKMSQSKELKELLEKIEELLPSMIKLAELEKAIEMMAADIERTRRRVNALEYILIPNLSETISFIDSKLSELERFAIVSLMRIKDVVRG